MKIRIVLPALLLVGAILFASCALGLGAQVGTGSLSLVFPMGSLSRAVSDTTYLVRVFYGLDLYDQEPEISGDQITFTDLPLGEAWVFIAKGSVGTDGFFYPVASGDTEITIVAGQNDAVHITLDASPFQWSADLKGSNIVGLTELDGSVYASTDRLLYKGTYTSGTFATVSGPEVPDGVEINSLSVGTTYDGAAYASQVWVNGSWNATDGGGIMPWTASNTLDNGYSAGFAPASDLEIIHSGAFAVGDGLAVFFQRDGGLGGVFLANPTEYAKPKVDWPWIVDEINLGELLADMVENPDDLILDFEVNSSTAYVVSTLITAKVSESIISGDAAGASAEDLLNSDHVAFAPELGSPITDLDLDEANSKIYMATENGLYMGTTSTTSGEFLAAGTQAAAVPGTRGYSIKRAVSSKAGSYVAFITKRGNNPDLLSLIKLATNEIITYRTLEGLPGEDIQSLVWLDDNVLAIGGNRGLVAIDASGVF